MFKEWVFRKTSFLFSRVLLLLLIVPLLSGMAVQAAQGTPTARNVFGDGLGAGWMNWSWDTTVNLANATPVHGGTASLAATFTNAWGGIYLRLDGAAEAGYDTLRFWIHGGNGGQKIGVFFVDQNNGFTQGATLQPQANAWTPVDVPLTAFGPSSNLWGLVWQENNGTTQPTFYLDDIQLIGSGIVPTTQPPQSGPALAVDAAAGQHAISPYIYGLNFADPALAADIRLPVNRWGGNATTRYNWQNDTSNRASDWYFENIPNDNPNPQTLPVGSSSDQFVNQNKASGTDTLMTVPLIGWTPRDRQQRCGFGVSKYGAQQSVDPYFTECGNGVRGNGTLITGNDPLDTSTAITPTFVQDWIRHFNAQFGAAGAGGVRFYNLDNEPALWNSTHRDVHPNPLSYDELRDRTFQYASAIKAVDPAAQTLGPAEWGWTGYFWSALDAAPGGAWWNNPQDRNAHGGVELTAWYLQQMQAYEQQNGVRILDYLDLHYYPQGAGVALSGAGSSATQSLRLRSTRSLWDSTYTDESWINDKVMLIPRMRNWVNQNYPGTKLAITEYNFGALDHINGAVAQADVLGIFGREAVDLATLWDPPTFSQPGAFAFRMYRNYDGAGGAFGTTGVQANSSNQEQLSVYAAVRPDGALTIMIINKTGSAITSPLTLSNFSAQGSAAVYRYSAADLNQIVRESDLSVVGNSLTATYPPSSITLLVIPTGTTPPTPVPPTATLVLPTVTPLPPSATPLSITAPPTSTPVVPTATLLPTTTPVPPTATLQEPTAVPTLPPTPAGAAMQVEVNPPQAEFGQTVTVALRFYNVANLYGLQADCQVDPAVLLGTTRSDGDIFTAANSFTVDTGYQPDGSWAVASSLLNPAPAFNGTGTAFTLNYLVAGAGSTAVNCSGLVVDVNGNELPVTVVNGSFTGGGAPTPVATLTATPGEPTAVSPTPTFTAVPPTPSAGFVAGAAAFEKRQNHTGIHVRFLSGSSSLAELDTVADGVFTFTDVPAGDYIIEASAPGHLTVYYGFSTDGQQGVDTGLLTLLAGDADNSGVIDLADAGLIGANFGIQSPPAPTVADFNADGLINLIDLVLVGKNFGKSVTLPFAPTPTMPPTATESVLPTATLVPTTVPPTSTSVPPTATLVPTLPPPTATVVPTLPPPTATPIPPTPVPTATQVAVSGPRLGNCPVFPADNAWNADISSYPVHPNSAAYVASINSTNNKFLHADFGENPGYGIPYVVVDGSQPKVPITFTAYGDESDPGPYPIPPNAPVEGGGDRHVLVADGQNCMLYELFNAEFNGTGWNADSGAVFNLLSNALRPLGWTSADAAGLPVLPGLVRYDEVAAGVINHALRFTVSQSQRAFILPATHFASSSTSANLPPMGLRLRLRADYDISRFTGQARVILEALKKYGMIVADNGSSWFISGATDSRWIDNDLNQLKTVPGNMFEAVYTGELITQVP